MTEPRDDPPVLLRPVTAVLGGLVAGVLLASAVVIGWSLIRTDSRRAGYAASRPDSRIGVFRLDGTGGGELLLAPAGPDGTGEPAISTALFPDEVPARELASVLVANTNVAGDAFEVDLASVPLRARAGTDQPWFDLQPIRGRDDLAPTVALRLRTVGGTRGSVTVAPGKLSRLLVALPPGRQLSDVSDVQWGERPLLADRMDLETLHAYREAPTSVGR